MPLGEYTDNALSGFYVKIAGEKCSHERLQMLNDPRLQVFGNVIDGLNLWAV